MAVFQTTFCVSLQRKGRRRASECPVPSGPRNCGQFSLPRITGHHCASRRRGRIFAVIWITGLSHRGLCDNGAMRLALLSLSSLSLLAADLMPPVAEQKLAREIYKEMIEVKSG